MPTPTNLSELTSARLTAGQRYATAVAELKAAWIDLAALDKTAENRSVAPLRLEAVGTFGSSYADIVAGLRHGTFWNPHTQPSNSNWQDAADAQARIYIRAIAGPGAA